MTELKNKRAVSVSQLINTKHRVLPFEGEWLASFGKPELTGTWFVWGNSANGKTRFVLQLCKYFCRYAKVAYNSLEEGASKSMRDAFIGVGMEEVKRRIILLDQEPMHELIERLAKRKSPDIVVIDSIQYSGLNYKTYKDLRGMFPRKLFIMISHADGKTPSSRVAKSIRFDAFVKIWVEGFKAFPQSRFGGNEPLVIWHEGAEKYWGEMV